jgi:hypothetical protein
LLGLFVSVWLMFSLVVTVLQPLALAVLPAAFIFVAGIWQPSILVVKGVRIYLIGCMAAGELLWIWAGWEQFVRVRS